MVTVKIKLRFWQKVALLLGQPLNLHLGDSTNAIVKTTKDNIHIEGYNHSSFHGKVTK